MNRVVVGLNAFPKTITTNEGKPITLKPLTSENAGDLYEFFLRLTEEDRYHLKEDVTSPNVIWRWVGAIDYERAVPIVAWDGRDIVAEGIVHRTRTFSRRHIGEISILIDKRPKQQGIGTALINELIGIARDLGIKRLYFSALAGKEEDAIAAACHFGFHKIATLPSYNKDLDGLYGDVVLMDLEVGALNLAGPHLY